MAMDSMLAAMCAALGAVSFDFGNLKITLEGLPVIIGAALLGPLDGAAVGFVGTFIYQILRYGFTATTFLWILPYVVCGLIVGWYAKKHGFRMTKGQSILIVVIAELVITTLNTGVLYVDSKIYRYYSAVFIFGTLLPRYAICVGKAIVVGALLPTLVGALKRFRMRRSDT
jgi:ECF transporter S component (folate family)